jgi:O-antigen/teichoic acid export membrane protein
VFGNYAGAWPFMIWLAIPTFIQSFYDTSDRTLIIAGQANVPLTATAASFAVLIVAPFATASLLGPTAIPAAMVASKLLFNPLVAARVQRIYAITTINPRDILMKGGGIVALASYALTGAAAAGVASVAVLGAIALYCWVSAMRRTGPEPRRAGCDSAER